MRSRDDDDKAEPAAVHPTVDPPKKKTADERLDDLEKRLEPLIGPAPKGD